MVEIHQGKRLQQLIHDKYTSANNLSKILSVSREYTYALFKKKYIPSEHIDTVCKHFGINAGSFFSAIDPPDIKSKLTILVVKGDVPLGVDPVTLSRNSIILCQTVSGL